MTKHLIAIGIATCLMTLAVIGQDKEKEVFDPQRLPTEVNTHLITYIDVIKIPSVPSKEMFKRGLNWFGSYYKNPANVMRDTDSIRGTISGKARFKIYNPADKKGLKTDAGNVEYSISLGCKEGKYRYTITEINWKQVSYYPIEKWMDTTAQNHSKVYLYYLEETDSLIKEITKNLEVFMKTSPAEKKDDW